MDVFYEPRAGWESGGCPRCGKISSIYAGLEMVGERLAVRGWAVCSVHAMRWKMDVLEDLSKFDDPADVARIARENEEAHARLTDASGMEQRLRRVNPFDHAPIVLSADG